jgi:hypothetical protein
MNMTHCEFCCKAFSFLGSLSLQNALVTSLSVCCPKAENVYFLFAELCDISTVGRNKEGCYYQDVK